MNNRRGYVIISQESIVAMLPATVREIAEAFGRDVTSINERIRLMLERHIVRAGPKLPRHGMRGPTVVYYPGTEPPSKARAENQTPEQRRAQNLKSKAEARKIKNEVKRLTEELQKMNNPYGFQYGVPAPLGVELILLTTYGKLITGEWKGLPGDLYITWAYPPKRNLESEKILARIVSLTPNPED